MEKPNPLIVMTGGHAGTTAIATVTALKEKLPDVRIIWIGVKSAVEGNKSTTLESEALPKLGVKFTPLTTGRLQRKFTRHTIPSLMRIPIGFIQAFKVIYRLRPSVTVSFGGAVSVPVVVASWFFRIPIVIHEQTAAVGLANKLSAPFAKKVAIARDESREYFTQEKVVLTGNPVSKEIGEIRQKHSMPGEPHILVVGGSRGSTAVNKLVIKALPELLKSNSLTHITGTIDFETYRNFADSLGNDHKARYTVHEFIHPSAMPDYYKKADLIISRAGANTVSEILVTGRPAVLIPIPWARYSEQYKNALIAKEAGLATILDQERSSEEDLINSVNLIKSTWKPLKITPRYAELDRGAATALAEIISSMMQ